MNNLMNTIIGGVNKVGFQVKKHSPEILLVAGVVGVTATVVTACKATLKLNDILNESKEKLEKINEVSQDPKHAEEYSAEDAKKDKLVVGVQTTVKVVQLYAPSIALGMLSIGCIFASNHILRTRNVAIAAALTTVTNQFKDYRNRVVERFGKDIDHELRHNLIKKKIEVTAVNEDGEVTTQEIIVDSVDEKTTKYSDYSKFYTAGCAGWEKNPTSNRMFLQAQQNWANDRLIRDGYLFLNDVYKALGIDLTQAGQVVGWTYDLKKPKGDNYVDFGFHEVYPINENEPTILLDFNVDGYILDNAKIGHI